MLSIEQSVYFVDEEDGRVSIRVSITGERITTVFFSIVTSNESATGKEVYIFLLITLLILKTITVGIDYSTSRTTFSLQPNDNNVLLNIDIIDDNIVEEEEFFDLGILTESVGAVVENGFTHIRIRDVDSKHI